MNKQLQLARKCTTIKFLLWEFLATDIEAAEGFGAISTVLYPPRPSENSFYRFFNFQFISVSTYKMWFEHH